MLTNLTRKLCPFMTLALATVGCGKKITDADTSSSNSIDNQALPSAYSISLDSAEGRSKRIRSPHNARFYIPDILKIRSGNPAGAKVEVAYDVYEFDSDDYDFKCIYSPVSSTEMILESCVDYNDNSFDDVSEQEFTIRRNEIIEIRYTGTPAAEFVVDALYSMKWL